MKFGAVLGVRVKVHPLFLALLCIAALGGQGKPALIVVGLLLSHELAHVLVARAYGLEVEEIEFLPFGGVARLRGLSTLDPAVESVVALAGPLNNFLLLALGVLLWEGGASGPLTELFIEGNLALALFNLIPVLPLDGGRFCRGLMAPRLGHERATRFLARTGRVFAVAMVAAGALAFAAGLFAPNLILLGFFLYFASTRELAQSGWEGIQVLWRGGERLRRRRVMPVRELVAFGDTPLRDIIPHLTPQHYHVIRVIDDRLTVIGCVEEPALWRGLREKGARGRLADLITRADQ